MTALPEADDVLAAAARIAGHADLTPVLQSRVLDALAGCSLLFKAEHLQRGGAFKFRGACNAVWSLDAAEAAHGVVTHSSGNHGAALALAARSRGIPCHVVVPEGAVAAKLAVHLAGNLTESGSRIEAAREYLRTVLSEAKAIDAQEGGTDALLVDAWLAARS